MAHCKHADAVVARICHCQLGAAACEPQAVGLQELTHAMARVTAKHPQWGPVVLARWSSSAASTSTTDAVLPTEHAHAMTTRVPLSPRAHCHQVTPGSNAPGARQAPRLTHVPHLPSTCGIDGVHCPIATVANQQDVPSPGVSRCTCAGRR